AHFIKGYSVAVNNPNKFCHGFGIFQYDLQHFKNDPEYFLQKKWADPKNSFLLCIKELFEAKARQGWKSKITLNDNEKIFVAIAYNRGKADLSRGFKQGHQSADGRFYGENIFDYFSIAKSVTTTGIDSTNGPAPIPAPTPLGPAKKIYRVKVTSNTLNLRSEPAIPADNPSANRIVALPNGHLVSLISGSPGDRWFEVETSLNGAKLRGFAASDFLELVTTKAKAIPVMRPFGAEPQSGIVAVFMPQISGRITKRTGIAGPFSLNEPNQPSRSNTAEPSVLRKEIIKIIEWLNVERPTHKRYQPGEGKTFCNIYAHDFCYLAGVYLPRVWWTQRAIEKLARNEIVQPLLNATIEEIRANGIFSWLRDFGERFGWRQTGDLTKLQNAANLGGIGLIITKRVEDGRSGRITMLVPEVDDAKARRNASGDVIAPLQSQAGAVNFNRGTGKKDWWLDAKFKDHAFWIHA
ncbi:MAG TPA: hypothetical protein VFH07_11440, partial [Chitinophagaceae bacterium]|nr:hypothetical protein [Chitinophagaceae bacterium]